MSAATPASVSALHRDAAGQRPIPLREPARLSNEESAAQRLDGLAALDDPQEWAAFGQPDPVRSGHWDSVISISGMYCAACALTLEAALRAVPGVTSAEVSAASRRARVGWESDATLPSRWMAAVEQAGYRAAPATDLSLADERRAEQRTALWRWLVAGFCMMQVMMYAWPLYTARPGDMAGDEAQLLRWASWVLTLPVLIFSCTPFFRNALRDLRHRRIGMDLPVALGMAITFAVSSAATFDPAGTFGGVVYFDSLAMFAFFLLTGRWLEARLRGRTAGALDVLLHRLPETVLRRVGDAAAQTFERVAVRRVRAGDVLRVLPGEAFPGDGVLLDGETSVDEALLTGEAHPLVRGPGAGVIAGSYNLVAPVLVRIERTGAATRFSQIAALMQRAAVEKPPIAHLADRFARPFLWCVLAAALLALLLWWPSGPAQAWMIAAAVLVVTCPCALSLATPAAMLAAAGALARQGVLVRRLAALEALARVDTVVFDKTGTLTDERMRLERIHARAGIATADALDCAAALARESRHPVARALVAVAMPAGAGPGRFTALQVREVTGRGVQGLVRRGADPDADAVPTRLGSAAFCSVDAGASHPGRMRLHLADDRGWLATFDFAEQLRQDAADAVRSLRAAGLSVEVLSGDRADSARQMAHAATIEHARGDCTPDDKLSHVQALQRAGRRVAMVGDGLNDGPVLAAADASFALGQAVPLAQAQADFVVPGQRLAIVAETVLLARRTLRVVRQNLWWAAGYNAVGVPLAMAGFMPAWLAGLGMAASSLLVVANAARLARVPSALEVR